MVISCPILSITTGAGAPDIYSSCSQLKGLHNLPDRKEEGTNQEFPTNKAAFPTLLHLSPCMKSELEKALYKTWAQSLAGGLRYGTLSLLYLFK